MLASTSDSPDEAASTTGDVAFVSSESSANEVATSATGSTTLAGSSEDEATTEGIAEADGTFLLEDGIVLELVALPGGSFSMGSAETEVDRVADEIQHAVTVSAFDICRTEMTQGQWQAVTGSPSPSDLTRGDTIDHPVQRVTWEETAQFLNDLTTFVNRTRAPEDGLTLCYQLSGADWTWDRACTGFRLPTEAEWEYAARAGTTTAYSFGDDPALLTFSAWYQSNAEDTTHPVGLKSPNAFELYDMHGNVREWVWDWYGPYPVEASLDEGGPLVGDLRGQRGGNASAGTPPAFLRSAMRWSVLPYQTAWTDGFRCARGAYVAS